MILKVKYHNPELAPLQYIGGELGGRRTSNWIDLRSAEDVELKAGEHRLISLGVAMELPEGYEAIMAPRSSTFKNWGILQTNAPAIIDEAYCGTDDIWRMSVYATRNTTIHINDRIAQFRIQERQPDLEIKAVNKLRDTNRGGFGATGKN